MIFLELVPRDLQALTEEASQVLSVFSELSGINIPEISRLNHRSHDAALHLTQHAITSIPHIRAIDRPLQVTLNLVRHLFLKGITSVLVVGGDIPSNPSVSVHDVSSVELIATLKKEIPAMKVYAALDPYRQSLKEELAYSRRKQEAGVDGFFTQPFFDIRLAEIYLEQLSEAEIFLGTSPVLTEKSLQYWHVRNHVVFPPSFSLDFEKNAMLSRQLIQLAQDHQQHVYLMPITCPVKHYLDLIF